jgi:membrane protease YdiL (CAAX protease family)
MEAKGGVPTSAIWLLAFFVVVYVASAAAWVPILRSGRPFFALPGPLALLALAITLMPSLVAIVLSGLREGWPGMRALLGQAGRWGFGLPWYVVALALTVLLDVVALALSALLGSPAGALGPLQLQLLLPFAPLGEEFGWRGYALPRLQRRMAALPASLVLGVIWACWHLPYFAYPSIHPLPFAIGFPQFVVVITCESVLATWIYNSTGGSLLATILFHEGINFGDPIPVGSTVTSAIAQAVVFVVAAGAVIAVAGPRRLAGRPPVLAPEVGHGRPGGG